MTNFNIFPRDYDDYWKTTKVESDDDDDIIESKSKSKKFTSFGYSVSISCRLFL